CVSDLCSGQAAVCGKICLTDAERFGLRLFPGCFYCPFWTGRTIIMAVAHCAAPLPKARQGVRGLAAVLAALLVICLIVAPLPAMPNSRSLSPNADLIAAVERSNLAGVRAALRRGATGDATDPKGRTVCRLAVERGNLEIVKLLAGNSHAFAKSRDGETA